MSVVLITGASRGLGRATALAFARRGDALVVDARGGSELSAVAAELRAAGAADVVALAGSVADAAHRAELRDVVDELGRLDVLVNNASLLGPSPQPPLADYPLDVLEVVYAVNVLAPLGLGQLMLPYLRASQGRIVNVTSDAAVEPYGGWGGYGSSKAALDQISAILAAEEPDVRVYAFDPGDMRTTMHQQAYPGEDISDRAEPETVVPALLSLVDNDVPSGRYQASKVEEWTGRTRVVA
jgi:NAD(P)-dependent dehydrogenase (short-subunit alcohol dehydrogenase family)